MITMSLQGSDIPHRKRRRAKRPAAASRVQRHELPRLQSGPIRLFSYSPCSPPRLPRRSRSDWPSGFPCISTTETSESNLTTFIIKEMCHETF